MMKHLRPDPLIGQLLDRTPSFTECYRHPADHELAAIRAALMLLDARQRGFEPGRDFWRETLINYVGRFERVEPMLE